MIYSGPQGDVGKVLREGGPDAVPVLCDLLGDDDSSVRMQAILAHDSERAHATMRDHVNLLGDNLLDFLAAFE